MQSELWRYSKGIWPVVIAYVLLATALLIRLQVYPSVVRNGDAYGYIEIALSIRSHGLLNQLAVLGPQRTYGYPIIVYLYSLLAGSDHLRIALVAGIFQLGIYAITVLWLASLISRVCKVLAHAVAIGLLLNPVVVALVADVLSESATLTIVVLALICLLNLARDQGTLKFVLWALLGAALTNFSIMIRPSNIFVAVAWNTGLLLQLFLSREAGIRDIRPASYAVAWIASAAIVWAPQYLYNVTLGSHSILPVYPLIDAQLKWGIVLLKYATLVVVDHAEPFLFVNPWCVPDVPDVRPGVWYLEHPLQGAMTVAGHLYHAFNVELPFTYTHDPTPLYSWPASFVMWVVTIVGLSNAVAKISRFVANGPSLQSPACAPVTMCILLISLIISLNGLLAIETRFNMVPIAAASIFAAEFFLRVKSQSWKRTLFTLGGAVCIALLASVISEVSLKSAAATRLASGINSISCLKN